MAIVSAAILTDRGVVKVSGPDAAAFLQGLITNDIHLAAQGMAIHAGLLTPQGKILFEFMVAAADDDYFIDCAAAHLPALIKRLGLYKLRSKVEIEDLSPSHQVAALWPAPVAAAPGMFTDPRLADMGVRAIGTGDALQALIRGTGADKRPAQDYHKRRIGYGIAEMGQDYGSGETYPHEVNFDLLGGVHFSKGCYVGQEVVSRMKHKTNIRKRFVPVALSGGLPEMGAEILADGKAAGVFGSASDGRGLALLRLDRIGGAEKITVEGAKLSPVKPDWADFDIPGAG